MRTGRRAFDIKYNVRGTVNGGSPQEVPQPDSVSTAVGLRRFYADCRDLGTVS